MSFELPDLDNRDYDQLLADLLRRIPQYTPLWTDYNDSDPGITLLQLLCWIDESLLHQANAIPLQTQQNFLRWVLGLAFSTNETAYSRAAVKQHDFAFEALRATLAGIEAGVPMTAADLQRAVLDFVDRPYLALTLSAVEALARETNAVIAAQQATGVPLYVRRADAAVRDETTVLHILSNAAWHYRYPDYPNRSPSVNAASRRRVLLVQPEDVHAAEQALHAQVRDYLAPRVLAGNAVDVFAARITPIDLAVVALCDPAANLDATLDALAVTLFAFFLPDRQNAAAAAGVGTREDDGIDVAPALPDAVLAWKYGVAPDAAQVQQLVLDAPGVQRLLGFELQFVPTLALDLLAELGVNTLLAALPPGAPALEYRGLPRLRCLDVTVTFGEASA